MSPPRRIPVTSSITAPSSISSATGPTSSRRIASHGSINSVANGGSSNGNGGMGIGSGSNTEMRAQLRREREAQKREATITTSSSASQPFSSQHQHQATSSSSSNNQNASNNHGNGGHGMSASNSSPNNKLESNGTQSNPTSGRRVISEGGLSIPDPQPASNHHHSWNSNHQYHQPSQKITASASNSSLGSAHTHASSNLARPASASTADTSPFEHHAQQQQQQQSQQHGSNIQPPEPFDNSFGLEALQAAYTAKYYEIANKCKNWERYSAKLRAQAEALEIENRLLRELNSRQEDQIGGLHREKDELRREMEWQSRDKKDVEDRLTSLQRLLSNGARSRSNSRSADRDFEASRLGSHSLLAEDGSGSYHSAQHDQSYAQGPKSAPLKGNMLVPAKKLGNFSSSIGNSSEAGLTSPPAITSSQSVPYCSSNLAFDEDEAAERAGSGRVLSPVSNVNLTAQIHQLYDPQNQSERSHLYSHEQSHSAGLVMTHGGQPHTLRPASRTGAKTSSGSDAGSHQWNNPHDILAADAAYRDTAAIYGEGRSSKMGNRTVELHLPSQLSSGPRTAPLTSSATFPSLSLTDQALSQHQTLRAGTGSTGVQRLRVSPNKAASSSSHSANGSQLGAGYNNVPKRRSTNSAEPGVGLTSASVPSLHLGSESSTLLGTGRTSNGARAGSAASDAATVTGEYLREDVEVRKQSRRSTLNQQQRDQFQAQLEQQQQHSQQRSGDDGGMPSAYPTSIGGRPPSRPTSRMSNLSTGSRQPGGRSRSRAGSVHDSIPIVMDDVFSERSRSKMDSRNGSSSQTQLNSHASNASIGMPTSASAPEFTSAQTKGGRSRSPLQQLQVNSQLNANGSISSGSIAGNVSHHSNSSFDPEGDTELLNDNYYNDEDEDQFNDNENEENQAPYPYDQPASPSPESKRFNPSNQNNGNPSEPQQMNSNVIASIPDTPSSLSLSSQDPRGAHRALYSRLRNELAQNELTKFEKYVHRYDALEIPLDGPRGLVNRVKKLLLVSDPTVRENPDKLRSRKQLAREFERIVRVDLE